MAGDNGSPEEEDEPVKRGKKDPLAVRRAPMHEPTRLGYRLTEQQKVAILNKNLRPREVVREAHHRRHGKHKRIVARPAKPANVPTGWEARWSDSQISWYFWCPLTNATCWTLADCDHDVANVQKLVDDKGGLPFDSPYVKYTRQADAVRQKRNALRASSARSSRSAATPQPGTPRSSGGGGSARAQSAGTRRPQSSDGRTLSARAQFAKRPQSARVISTIASVGNARSGPHPPSSTHVVYEMRAAQQASSASARASAPMPLAHPQRAEAQRSTEDEANEAPWMLGRPADKYGRVPLPPREAQIWSRMRVADAAAAEKENAAQRKARSYGRGVGYRKHCMRIDVVDQGFGNVTELQDYESKDWRTRGNPGLPREYRHVLPKQEEVKVLEPWEQDQESANIFAVGDHVWLAGDPMAPLKNGSGLFQKEVDQEHHLGPFGKSGRKPPDAVVPTGVHKPTGLVTAVQARTGECLVEWGKVGSVPLGTSRKLLWCTPDEIKQVPMKHKMKHSLTNVKSSMRMSLLGRTASSISGVVDGAEDAAPELITTKDGTLLSFATGKPATQLLSTVDPHARAAT